MWKITRLVNYNIYLFTNWDNDPQRKETFFMIRIVLSCNKWLNFEAANGRLVNVLAV